MNCSQTRNRMKANKKGQHRTFSTDFEIESALMQMKLEKVKNEDEKQSLEANEEDDSSVSSDSDQSSNSSCSSSARLNCFKDTAVKGKFQKGASESEGDMLSTSAVGVVASGKAKGVSALIKIANPNRSNRVDCKWTAKRQADANATNNDNSTSFKPHLNRREREQLKKQEAFNSGKIDLEDLPEDTREDLARLAEVRQIRIAEAAKRSEAEARRKEQVAAKAKTVAAKLAKFNEANK